MTTRRDAIATIGTGLLALAGCGRDSSVTAPTVDGAGRLTVRPRTPDTPLAPGATVIEPTFGIIGYAYVPTSYRPSQPAPASLVLHGGGEPAASLIESLLPMAEASGEVLLAIGSSDVTWDLVRHGAFGADIPTLNKGLGWLFDRVVVDPARLGVLGFSDGATYALALGRANGDLFRRVVAYSPGALAPVTQVGTPQFYITHGTEDDVFAVAQTRDGIVPLLRSAGYQVEYHEFAGGHGIPEDLEVASIAWIAR
ncbi:MAG TPA: hypothetical protein VG916_09070 [Gemmatimonadaceae bacterium]|nr:hypothetical protein [Gemmatimonadaceae bacterium]